MALLKRLLALLVVAFLLAPPALAGDVYFSDCDYDPHYPTCTPLNQTDFTCMDVADGFACDTDYVSSACHCPFASGLGFSLCSDWYLAQSALTAGTKGNPWCLAPEQGGSRISFTAMSDAGAGTALTAELAAGDTVKLCAGACDAQGTAIWYVQASATQSAATGDLSCDNHTKPIFWQPQADGTSVNAQIKIEPYCEGQLCETVLFTSDSNGNGAAESTEPAVWMANSKNATTPFYDMGWIWIDGDPANTGTPHLGWSNWGGTSGNDIFAFDCTDDTSADPDDDDGVDNITIHGISVDGFGFDSWSGQSMFDGGCIANNNQGRGGFVIKVNDAGGPVNFTKNRLLNICGMVTRYNNNPDISAIFNVTDNYAENGYQFSNDHDFNGPFPAAGGGATFNYRRNLILDFWGGLGVENNVNNANITDNVIGCTGSRRMSDFYGGGCLMGISVNDGDTPTCGASCYSNNNLIARNTIYGPGCSSVGSMGAGIVLYSSNLNGSFSNFVVENNVLKGICSPISGGSSTCSLSSDALFARSAIGVCTPTNGLVLRNNTAWGGRNGITLTSTGASVLQDNLVGFGQGQELTVFSGAVGSTLTDNLLYDTSPVTFNGSTYTCANVSSSLNNGGTRTLNFCPAVAPAFVNSGGLVPSWDLRLGADASGALNGDAACIGATTDFNQEVRPWPDLGACDLGADEQVLTPAVPVPVIPARPSSPVRSP